MRCMYCGCEFRAIRSDSRYCSRACRQAAYRARKMISYEEIKLHIHEARVRAVATKRAQSITLTCLECGKSYEVSGLATLSQYCSGACRVRVHRRRNKMLRDFLMSVVNAEKEHRPA